jgi:hypothetical protein
MTMITVAVRGLSDLGKLVPALAVAMSATA